MRSSSNPESHETKFWASGEDWGGGARNSTDTPAHPSGRATAPLGRIKFIHTKTARKLLDSRRFWGSVQGLGNEASSARAAAGKKVLSGIPTPYVVKFRECFSATTTKLEGTSIKGRAVAVKKEKTFKRLLDSGNTWRKSERGRGEPS